jgi:hypothetical protein
MSVKRYSASATVMALVALVGAARSRRRTTTPASAYRRVPQEGSHRRRDRVSGYTWVQAGLTSFTGGTQVQNRFYDGESLGAIVHITGRSSIWIQEAYNKIATVPWHTTTSVGYTWSW